MNLVLADTIETIGVVAGVVGAVATILGLAAVFARFRPKFDVTIDERRQAIRVKISNAGRLQGRINGVSVLDATDHEVPSEFAGLSKGAFHSGLVSRKEARSLVINAGQRESFADGVRVFVQWGRRRKKEITPDEKSGVSYYGEKSNWPASS
jgi:hypothetical protein